MNNDHHHHHDACPQTFFCFFSSPNNTSNTRLYFCNQYCNNNNEVFVIFLHLCCHLCCCQLTGTCTIVVSCGLHLLQFALRSLLAAADASKHLSSSSVASSCYITSGMITSMFYINNSCLFIKNVNVVDCFFNGGTVQ